MVEVFTFAGLGSLLAVAAEPPDMAAGFFCGGRDWGERAKGRSGEGAVEGKGQSAADGAPSGFWRAFPLGTESGCKVCWLWASDRSAERGVVVNGLMIFPRSERGATLEYECQCDVGRVSGIASWPPVRLLYIYRWVLLPGGPPSVADKINLCRFGYANNVPDRSNDQRKRGCSHRLPATFK